MKKINLIKFACTLLLSVALAFPMVMLTGCSGRDNRDIVMVAAGFDHSLALRTDGTVWAWGRNEEGQLGDGSRTNRFAPVYVRYRPVDGGPVVPLDRVTQIASHKIHSMALRDDGTVWTWGWNQEGQLGAGGLICSALPVQVRYRRQAGETQGQVMTNVVAIEAGMLFSVALKSNGEVWAWGRNRMGTLGDPNTPDRHWPVRLAGISDVVAISAGNEHLLMVRSDGTVWSVGRNRNGQLGDGTVMPHDDLGDDNTGMRTSPVQVLTAPNTPLSNIVSVAGGAFHSAALTRDGHVYTWGRGDRGQLGFGATELFEGPPMELPPGRTRPGHIGPLNQHFARRATVDNVKQIAHTASDSTMALKNDGTVWVWGRNAFGGLGDGTLTDRNLPVQVSHAAGGEPITDIVSIAAGQGHKLALRRDGVVETWGKNWDGQLGIDNHERDLTNVTPQQVNRSVRAGSGFPPAIDNHTPLTGISEISAGDLFTLARHEDGRVFGWGRNNHGQLVMQQATDHRMAEELFDFRMDDIRFQGVNRADTKVLDDVVTLSAGNQRGFGRGLAITEDTNGDRLVWGWGDNDRGSLGIGETNRNAYVNEPKDFNPREMEWGTLDFNPNARPVAVAAGGRHSLILFDDGAVWSTGNNASGQLGLGNNTQRITPARIPMFGLAQGIEIVGIEASHDSSFAWSRDGRLWAWGANGSGQLGNRSTTNSNTPVQVHFTAAEIVQVSSHSSHVLARCAMGSVFAWGAQGHGQLGRGELGNWDNHQLFPVQVPGLGNISDIAAGPNFSLALRTDGRVFSWGLNNFSQLGRQTTWHAESRAVPQQVTGLTNVRQIAAGAEHSVALLNDGTVRTWGSNNAGALGTATTERGVLGQTHAIRPMIVQGGGTGDNQFNALSRNFANPPDTGSGGGLHPVATFFIVFFSLFLVGIIVLFILDNRRIIDIKRPKFIRSFFDKIPIKRAPQLATAGVSTGGKASTKKPAKKTATAPPKTSTQKPSTSKPKTAPNSPAKKTSSSKSAPKNSTNTKPQSAQKKK